jgi:apyrase
MYVDAGSSGSRLHIFQYDTTFPTPVIKDIFSTNTKPGLSSYIDHPEQAGASLKVLLDSANQYFQQNAIDSKNIQLNILATAGMRILPETKQQAIYNNINTYLTQNYSFKIGKVTTIPGQLEALYGWLDVNYMLENFQRHQPTVGSIDMGGASTQIAFETQDKKLTDNKIAIKIDNQAYVIFGQSFLGLGQDQARAAMTADKQAAYCYPVQYTYDSNNKGAYNFESCGAIYQQVIKNKLNGLVIPVEENTRLIAYSGIYFSHNFFGVDQKPDQAALEQSVKRICSKTWNELKKEFPAVAEKYLSGYCADGVYHDQLLYATYHLKGSQLQITNTLNGKEIDWTLGALLYDLVTA